jgi:excisionase family DNA binding protein
LPSWLAFSPARRLENGTRFPRHQRRTKLPHRTGKKVIPPPTPKVNTMSIEHAPRPDKDRLTLHTIPQTAKRLQVSTKTVRRWIDAGDLIAHRFGRQFRISDPDLMAFIKLRREA